MFISKPTNTSGENDPSENTFTVVWFTWKMAYMMQLRGLLLENSATLNMLKLHLSRSSNSWSNTTHTQTNKYESVNKSRIPLDASLNVQQNLTWG